MMMKSYQRGTGHAVTAGFLGWTLDAFDFFVVIFLYDILAAQFHVEKSAMLWTTTATLAFRPVGAVIFGMTSKGIVYAEWNPDWFKFFLGAMLLLATLLNAWVRKRAEATK